jgi:hypothetical protein
MISLYFTVKDVFFFNLISLVQTIELKKKKKKEFDVKKAHVDS